MTTTLIRVSCVVALIILFFANPACNAFAKEKKDNLPLKKSSLFHQKARPYVVKEGEWIHDILRKELGITSHHHAIIKKYNPHLKNPDKIKAGDIIMLPDMRPSKDRKGKTVSSSTAYKVKKGDSISSIASRQLRAKPADLSNAISQIKKLNPHIKNDNKVYPGQIIQLPTKSTVTARQDARAPEVEPVAEKKREEKEKAQMTAESRLDIIRGVIGRMNGSFLTTGKYYIPMPQTDQVAIDCAMVPIVEFDDGSTVFVDFADVVPDSLKTIIQTNWKNYHFVKADENESVVAILQRIFKASDSYIMTKQTTPVILGNNVVLKFAIDWIIEKKSAERGKPYLQGLILASDNSYLLPRPVTAFAEKNALVISEIVEGHGLASATAMEYAAPEMPVLPSGTGKDLAHALLQALGHAPVKDAEVKIPASSKDGPNPSITADILVKNGDRQVMFHSEKLSPQLIDRLKNTNIDTIYLDKNEPRKLVVEKTMQAMDISCTYGSFVFPDTEKTRPLKVSTSVPAFKIAQDKGFLYLINFDMDREIYGFLHHTWGVNFVKY